MSMKWHTTGGNQGRKLATPSWLRKLNKRYSVNVYSPRQGAIHVHINYARINIKKKRGLIIVHWCGHRWLIAIRSLLTVDDWYLQGYFIIRRRSKFQF